MIGKLISVERTDDGNRAASGHPNETYPRWKVTVLSDDIELTVTTGRPDLVKRAQEMIGQDVEIHQGKLPFIGAIRKLGND